jgi:hypothetical protein
MNGVGGARNIYRLMIQLLERRGGWNKISGGKKRSGALYDARTAAGTLMRRARSPRLTAAGRPWCTRACGAS